MKLPNVTGKLPTGIVLTTVFVEALITLTVFEPLLTTYNLLPSGVNDKPAGLFPTIMLSVIV